MLLKHWLGTLQQKIRFASPRTRRRSALGRHLGIRGAAAQAEVLEDRILLTNFVVNTLEDVVAVDTFISLREAIQAANTNTAVNEAVAGDENGDTITFHPDLAGMTITLNMSLGQLQITDDLSIDGETNDITISGNNQIRIFSINTTANEAVSLLDLTLTQGSILGNNGGAILIADGEMVTLDTVTITSSSATGNGGAIFAGDGTLDIIGSQIGDESAANQARNGGGIYVDGGTLTLDATTVSDNVATGNSATEGGGGIYSLGGTVTIENLSTVDSNTAMSGSGSGGGIFANGGMLTIDNSTVSNNTAGRAGGGLETRSTTAAVTVMITGASFTSNTVGSSPGNGGGLHVTSEAGSNASTITITGSTFTGNLAAAEGGAIWNDVTGTMTLNGVVISSNTASGAASDQGGGGVFNNGGTVTIQSNGVTATTIAGNFAGGTAGSGGGILNDGGTLTITGATIAGNTAMRAGGGIEATTVNTRDSNITLTSTTLVNNAAIGGGSGSPGNGGGVHISDAAGGNTSTFAITGGLVNENSAAAEGGGLWNDVGGTMTINGVAITSNTATGSGVDQGGGGVFNNGGTVTIQSNGSTASIIAGNTATGALGSGGGILNDGGTLTITGAVISGNTAIRAGGGIEASANTSNSNITITNTTIVNNDAVSGGSGAPGNGGGVHITDAAGGNTSAFTISRGLVSGNSAAAEGGGLWNDDDGTMTIRGVTISGNTASGDSADQGGGGIFNNGGTINIRNNATVVTTISNNFADGAEGSGGGILNDGGTLQIQGALIDSNSAVRAGGGIEATTANGRDSNVTLAFATISDNTVGSNPGSGGGIHISDLAGGSDSDFTIIGGQITGNSAAAEGGGIWNDVDGQLTITGTTISGNTASGAGIDQGGGGIFNNGGLVEIGEMIPLGLGTTIISDNIANGSAGSGGGILNDGGTLEINGALIDSNTAVRAGGGIEVTTANGRNSIVTVSNSTISNNTVGSNPGNGGGVHISDAAGGNTSTFTISGSQVIGNSAAAEGGGLWNAIGGTMNIDGVLILNNIASGDSADQGGGGIFNEGGIVNITSVADETVIVANFANGANGSGGGILNDGGTLNIDGVTITSNAAVRAGGGIEATTSNGRSSVVTITDTVITDNEVGDIPGNGGGVHISDEAGDEASTFTITGGSVTDNSAAAEGGGLWNDVGGMMTINGVTISGNTASGALADQGGGGVFNNGGTIVIQSNGSTATTIAGNIADGAAGSGGGILNDGGTLTILDAAISSNTAVRAGGGIEATTVNARNSTVSITDTAISGNFVGSSPGNGGGVHITDAVGESISNFTLTRGSVMGNTAASEGGGLWNAAGGVMTVEEVTISGNTANGNSSSNGGGGIFNDGGLLTVTGATISMNVATAGNGGGIFNEANGTAQVDETTISGNSVTGASATGNGGGVFNLGMFMAEDSTISTNIAATQGGGISNAGVLDLVQVTISGNMAATSGGGISTTDGTVDILNSTITNNRGTVAGGGLNIAGTDVFLESTIVAGNFQGTTTASDIVGAVLSMSQFNLIGIGTGLTGILNGTNNNQIGSGTPIDPLLGTLADNGGPTLTHELLPGSPAINAGSNPDDLEFDQRGEGFDRTLGPQTDIGSVEAQLNLTVVGSGPGDSRVTIFDAATGELLATINPYGTGFLGAIRTAVADVNGDGSLDVITGAGPGGGPHVKVFSGADNFVTELFSFFAFSPEFQGGVYVAAANFNPLEDDNADIVVAADAGGGPHVIVFNGTDLSPRQSFFAYPADFTGGVRVATGDISGDGIPDIITGSGPGGPSRVRVFDGSTMQFTTTPLDISQTLMNPAGDFLPYGAFAGGVFVASGDINGDLRDDIITGAGAGGGPHVKVFSGIDGTELLSFLAFDPAFLGGVTVGSTQGPDDDGIDDIIVGAGPGGGPHVQIYSGDTGAPVIIASFIAFEPTVSGGIFVSGATSSPSLGPVLGLTFGGGETSGDAEALSQAELDAFVGTTIERLEAAGASSAAIEALSSAEVRVSNLEDGLLGLALAGTILIDVDAAGAGWFIDPTPLDDFEFDADQNAIEAAALRRVDLLTVLLHELGHQLGAEDLGILDHPENLMAESLTTSKRRLPSEDLEVFFADSDLVDSVLS